MKALSVILLSFACNALAQSWSVTLYLNENYGGTPPFTTTTNVARISGPVYQQASSAKIINTDHAWTVLWESDGFNTHDDQLWIEGSRDMSTFAVPSRPHGNNSWNDLISGVSFSATPPPWDGNDNRSICMFNGPCVSQAQRMIQENPVIVNPRPEHPGWFVRVCPAQSAGDLTAINILLGNHNDPPNSPHFLWRTWYRINPTTGKQDPAEFNLPMNFLYIRDIWLHADGIPDGKQVSMCVGYYDHNSWKYTFQHGEDHQPDQEDKAVDHGGDCEC